MPKEVTLQKRCYDSIWVRIVYIFHLVDYGEDLMSISVGVIDDV